MEMSRDTDQKRRKKSINWQHLNHSSTSIFKNKSLVSATSILSRQQIPFAYNMTVSLKKLIWTKYVEVGNFQDRFRQFSSSKNDSHHLDFEVKIQRKMTKKVSERYKSWPRDRQFSKDFRD